MKKRLASAMWVRMHSFCICLCWSIFLVLCLIIPWFQIMDLCGCIGNLNSKKLNLFNIGFLYCDMVLILCPQVDFLPVIAMHLVWRSLHISLAIFNFINSWLSLPFAKFFVSLNMSQIYWIIAIALPVANSMCVMLSLYYSIFLSICLNTLLDMSAIQAPPLNM